MPTAARKSLEASSWEWPHWRLSTRSGLLDAACGVGRDQVVVHGLVQRGREDPLHHADGVGVEALFDLAGLEGADVGSRKVADPQASEERHQVVAAGPLVALEGALANLVAGRVGEPPLEILNDRQPPRVGEQNPCDLVGEGLELLVVGLLGSRAVEAHTPAAREGIQRGAGFVAAVLALARVRARPVRVLPFRPGHGAMIPVGSELGLACAKPRL